MGFRVRRAGTQDVAALTDLIAVSLRGLGPPHYTREQVESAIANGMVGVDTQLVLDGTYYVAEAGDEICGAGGWSRRRTLFGADSAKQAGEDDLLDPVREAARIRAFFTHPAWARRGIGTAILRQCEADARADGFRRLELMATLPGEPLYLAAGYQPLERVDLELPGGVRCPCVRMEKRIEG